MKRSEISRALKQGSIQTKAKKVKSTRPKATKKAKMIRTKEVVVKYRSNYDYLYGKMTHAEKEHFYMVERQKVIRKASYLSKKYGKDVETYVYGTLNDYGYNYINPNTLTPYTMKQMKRFGLPYATKKDIQMMMHLKEELLKIQRELENTVDPIDEAFSKIKTKLENILAVESAQGRYKSGTGSYKSLDAAKAEQLLEFVKDIENGIYGKDAKDEFARNVLEQWDKIAEELDEYIYNMYASYDDLTGKSTTEYLALIERLLPKGDPTINRLQEQENERSRVSNGWY